MRCVFAELDPFRSTPTAPQCRPGAGGRRVPGTSSVLYIDGGAPSGVPPSSSSSSGSPVGYSSRSMRAAKFEARAVGFAGLGQRLPV